MAEDLAQEQPALGPAVGKAPPTRSVPVYRMRFGLAYLVLAAFAGIAVGVAVLLINREEPAEGPAWSSWRPTGRETSYADQIAEYVANRYRLESGNQLAAVMAGPPVVQNLPVQAVMIENRSAVPNAEPQIEVFETGNSVMYTLCGLGDQCSIGEGQTSEEQLQLLRGQALELSLYTFKYVDDADSTIVLLPPDLGDPNNAEDDAAAAIFLRKQDFRRELSQPLARTLSRATPPTVTEFDPREGLIVDRLTEQNLFQYDYQQAPTGGVIIVLAPLTARR